MSTPAPEVGAGLVEVLAAHHRSETQRDCIEGLGWVYACHCDCGWHGPSADHTAHLARVVQAHVDAAVAAALTSPAAIEAGARAIRKRNHAAAVYNFHRWDAEAALTAAARIVREQIPAEGDR